MYILIKIPNRKVGYYGRSQRTDRKWKLPCILKECGCCYDIVEVMVDDEGEEYEDFRDCHNSLEGVEDILQWYVDEPNRVMLEN